MARAVGTRVATAKPAEKKEIKVNGTGTSQLCKMLRPSLMKPALPRRGAKKAEDAPTTNGVTKEAAPAVKCNANAIQ